MFTRSKHFLLAVIAGGLFTSGFRGGSTAAQQADAEQAPASLFDEMQRIWSGNYQGAFGFVAHEGADPGEWRLDLVRPTEPGLESDLAEGVFRVQVARPVTLGPGKGSADAQPVSHQSLELALGEMTGSSGQSALLLAYLVRSTIDLGARPSPAVLASLPNRAQLRRHLRALQSQPTSIVSVVPVEILTDPHVGLDRLDAAVETKCTPVLEWDNSRVPPFDPCRAMCIVDAYEKYRVDCQKKFWYWYATCLSACVRGGSLVCATWCHVEAYLSQLACELDLGLKLDACCKRCGPRPTPVTVIRTCPPRSD